MMRPTHGESARRARGAVAAGLIAACALATGCSPTSARVGVSPPPALLFKDYTTPLVVNPDVARSGRPMRDANVRVSSKAAYQLVFNIPGVPGASSLSLGWGGMDMASIIEQGGIEEVIYADARELSFLGVFTRTVITVYGSPKGTVLSEPPAGGPPGGGPPPSGPPTEG